MKRSLVITAAAVLLVAKGASLLYIRVGTPEPLRPVLLLPPGLYFAAAIWLWRQPHLARWPLGLFFLYVVFREASVFLQGTTWDIVRRSFSLPVAAWFAYAMLLGRGVPKTSARPSASA
jgi:hypothetical protein